jgi:hypothetical protein
MKVKAIVTEAKSYDVLVGSTVFYPMGFTLDFWEETASYRPGWQVGDGRKASLSARFIRVLIGNLADLLVFSGLVDAESLWFMETFDEKAFVTHLHMQVDAHVSAQDFGKHQSSPTRGRGSVEHHCTVVRSCRVSSPRGVARILIATRGGGE